MKDDTPHLPTCDHVEVFRKPGEYAGWPANYGLWAWDNELVCIFSQGFLGAQENLHARDMTRPFIGRQARSLDGGLTWQDEPFTGHIPHGQSLSGDEHVVDALQIGPKLNPHADLPALQTPIDFTDPKTIVMCARTGLGGGAVSWFYVSRDRAHSWQGPFRLGDFGLKGVAARTDIVVVSKDEALFFLSASKENGREGRVFCARTRDGGQSFSFESFVHDEPEGFGIMPASLRAADGSLLCFVRGSTPREADPRRAWIDLYRSTDDAKNWTYQERIVPSTGYGGNPPALATLNDGRIALIYGYRDAPYGMRARLGDSNGRSWSEEIILRDDGGKSDLGYPRAVRRGDGKIVSVYYFNDGDEDRFIAATIADFSQMP